MARVYIRLSNIKDPNVVYRLFKAMEPEFKFRRGGVSTSFMGNDVAIVIDAADLSSVRSLVNGVLKQLYLILSLQSDT